MADHVKTQELTQVMGHSDTGQIFSTYYRSNFPNVDISGILLNGKQANIDWGQYVRPERVEYGNLPLIELRKIEEKVCAIEGLALHEKSRLRIKLRNEARTHLKPVPEHQSQSQVPPPSTCTVLPDSAERAGDLRDEKTFMHILTTRFLPDVSIIMEKFDAPDFNIRGNGVEPLNALIRLLRRQKKGVGETSYYYLDESPVFGPNEELICGDCGIPLDE
jgi:hypothetical protein